jgi:hypothetical protein
MFESPDQDPDATIGKELDLIRLLLTHSFNTAGWAELFFVGSDNHHRLHDQDGQTSTCSGTLVVPLWRSFRRHAFARPGATMLVIADVFG